MQGVFGGARAGGRVVTGLFRVYFDPAEIGLDGYPYAWHGRSLSRGLLLAGDGLCDPDAAPIELGPAIKDLVREQAGHRCVRCGHPYRKGMGEWSPCDERCTHHDDGPIRVLQNGELMGLYKGYNGGLDIARAGWGEIEDAVLEAQWRVLTVHHLGEKYDCRWFMLVALCQRCHLIVQAKVQMNRVWPWEHSDWFKVYAAGWYAWVYEDAEITREKAIERMDELLAYERRA